MYWKAFERCVRSRLFDFVAHPDLVKIFGARPSGDLNRYYEPTVKALAESGGAFEINTAGLRKPVHEIYPALDFLKLARQAGVPLVINSDAHAPGQVGMDFDRRGRWPGRRATARRCDSTGARGGNCRYSGPLCRSLNPSPAGSSGVFATRGTRPITRAGA